MSERPLFSLQLPGSSQLASDLSPITAACILRLPCAFCIFVFGLIVSYAGIVVDGTSLVYKTIDEKLLIFSPPSLNFNGRLDVVELLDLHLDSVVLFTAGRLDPLVDRDILVVCSSTLIVAYDVVEKRQLFQRKLSEPPRSIAILEDNAEQEQPALVLVGGNCFIQAYDLSGNDDFWIVASDVVTHISILGSEIVIVCEDGSVFQCRVNGDLVFLMRVTQPIVRILSVPGGFLYLTKSMFGLFQNKKTIWSFPLDDVSISGVVIWQKYGEFSLTSESGEILTKSLSTGAHLHAVPSAANNNKIGHAITANFKDEQLMLLLTNEKSVLGYRHFDGESDAVLSSKLQQLKDTKKRYQEEVHARSAEAVSAADKYPADIKMIIGYEGYPDGLFLSVTTNHPEYGAIVALQLKSDKHFEGIDSRMVIFSKPSSAITVRIDTDVDINGEMRILAYIGQGGKPGLVLDSSFHLPLFAMYRAVVASEDYIVPKSQCSFTIKTDIVSVRSWIQKSFLGSEFLENESRTGFEIRLYSYRDKTFSAISVTCSSDDVCKISIFTENLDFAGKIIQDLVVDFLHISKADVICNFVTATERLGKVIAAIENIQQTKTRISGVVSENCSNIKAFLLVAEESYLLDQVNDLQFSFGQLYDQNKNALLQNKIRFTQHQELMSLLKQLNDFIQKSGNLRVGNKAELVQKCREVVGGNRLPDLLNEIQL